MPELCRPPIELYSFDFMTVLWADVFELSAKPVIICTYGCIANIHFWKNLSVIKYS